MAWKALVSCSCFCPFTFGGFFKHHYIPCKEPRVVDYEAFYLFLPVELNALSSLHLVYLQF